MKRHGPDSLNSWLVTAGLTFVSMILYAVVRLSGVLFVASMDRFGVDRKSASLPYILTDFIQAISSPLTGYLASKFGARLVMAFGCFVSGVGIASCFFVHAIGTITVCWGVVFGIGFGLSVPLLALVITQHFEKKRAIAMGIVFFGGYVGYSILPSIVEYMIEYYGLSGTYLLVSGIMLNCVPVALLLRKPKFSNLRKSTNSDEPDSIRSTKNVYEASKNLANSEGVVNYGFEKEISTKIDHSNTVERNEENENATTGIQDILRHTNTIEPRSPKFNNEVNERLQNRNHVTNPILETSTPHVLSSPNDKKPTSVKAFKVFLEPVYIFVLLAEAVFEGSFIAFVTILVDFSLDVGLAISDTKFVILAFSIASNIGLVSFGWVTDNGHLSLTNFSGLLLVLRCATSAFIPFSKSLPMLLTAVALHGLCEAPLSNLFPLIIAEYYDPEVHGVAISCRLFLCAPVYLVTPTLIGYFRDGYGSYFYLFLMISAASFVCGMLSFLAPQLSKCRCGRDESILRKEKKCQI